MKKLCIVSTSGNVVNAFMLKHIEYLEKNYDVTIIIGDDSSIRLHSKIKRIKIERPISLIQDIISLFKLYSIFKKEKFDIVFSLMPKSGLLSMMASYLLGVKVRLHFFTGQVWATKKGFFRKLLKVMDKIIVQCSTSVLIDSKSQKQFLIDENVMTEDDGYVLKQGSISGVDLDKFKFNINLKKQFRDKYDIKNSDIVFMFLGRINKDKGILDLQKVFLKLLDKYENTKLVLIGPIEDKVLENDLSTLFNHKNVISQLEFIDNPHEVLNMANVLVLPSYREGFGTIVIEAAAMSIPTIGSNIYGLSDAIVDKETGILHTVKDIEDMEIKYSMLIEDSTEIIKLGENAKNMVINNFSDILISEALVEFIKEKLNEE